MRLFSGKKMKKDELFQNIYRNWHLLFSAFLFSAFVNILMLTGPIYMLQVYDRVLSSRSVETLLGLTAIVVFLYIMMALLDYSRGRIMARAGARFQADLDRRVFYAVQDTSLRPGDPNMFVGSRDLETVQRFLSSSALIAIFDAPWTPIFLFGIFIFHPWLGLLAVCGGLVLILATIANQIFSKGAILESNRAQHASNLQSEELKANAETIRALGMQEATFKRWQETRNMGLRLGLNSVDIGGYFQAFTKAFRLLLQSCMLGLGAYLVILGELTAGAMIAASILLGRAISPIEQLLGQWPLVQQAKNSWKQLGKLLCAVSADVPRTALPEPEGRLDVNSLQVVIPGETFPTLKGITFSIEPGQVCGVIGASGSGKSTLARAAVGLWLPKLGNIKLGQAHLDNYENETLGKLIGYLPQRVQLFDGTVGDNISRFSEDEDPTKMHKAAMTAGVHNMILNLPNGYDTVIDRHGGCLSGGQIQQVGLARAVYGDPVLLVLDEPNSNLDNEGEIALAQVIQKFKQAGKAVLLTAHRLSALKYCSHLLILEHGKVRAFGRSEDVVAAISREKQQLIDKIQVERSDG